MKRWKSILVPKGLLTMFRLLKFSQMHFFFPTLNFPKTTTTIYCIEFCELLLHFGTCTYLFLPDEGSCYIFSTGNNCCTFLASYGVIIQSVSQSFLKTPICGASLTDYNIVKEFNKIFNFKNILHLVCANHNTINLNFQNVFLYFKRILKNIYFVFGIFFLIWKVFWSTLSCIRLFVFCTKIIPYYIMLIYIDHNFSVPQTCT